MTSVLRWCVFSFILIHTGIVQAEEPLDKLIAQLNQSIPGGRVDAARKLASRGPAAGAATETLITALGDTQPDMRLVSAYALGCVQNDPARALAGLLPVLADKDEHVRYSAQWSVAKIAGSIPAELNAAQAAELVSSLSKAMKEIRLREHQPRHLIAVELAHSRIEQLLPPKVVEIPVIQPQTPTDEQLQAQAMIEGLMRATNQVGRYQVVRRLSDWEAYPDKLRQMFIEKESREPDPSVFYYAIERWGKPGQELLAKLIDQRLSTGPLKAEDEVLLAELVPWDASTQQLLLNLINDATQAPEVRWSAANALGKSPQIDAVVLDRCLVFIDDDSQDDALRGALLEAMAALGPQAAEGEARLVALLQRNRDEAMRGIIARTLASIAPTSSQAVKAIQAEITNTGEDSPLFIDLVEAVSQFGPAAIGCQDQLLRGMRHQDSFTRLKCVNALARIGSASQAVAAALLEHCVDPNEEMPVKNAIASAINSLGQAGLAALSARINAAVVADDQVAMTDLFHLLAAMKVGSPTDSGPLKASRHIDTLVGDCLTVLSASRNANTARTAAATALGSLGRQAHTATLKLTELCAEKSPEELRGACLIALAQVDASAATEQCARFEESDSILLQASAAFAHHLCGRSRRGFDSLINLLDGSASDDVIASTLQDMGSVTYPWLIEVAADPAVLRDARLTAYRLACEIDAPEWDKLLPLLSDAELGDEFAACAEGPVQSLEGIESVLELIESQRLRPAAQARAAGLLSPEGLGAGEDTDDWQGLTLQQPSAMRKLARNESMAEASPQTSSVTEPSGGSAPPDIIALPTKSQPAVPAMPVHNVPVAPSVSRDEARVVNVFYGTNRGRVIEDNPHHSLALGVLATAGGGMLAMLVCLVGFVRSGNRMFALVALLAIAAVAPFGYQTAERYARESLNVAVKYDGTYRDRVELGICQVSIPPGHKPGELESPNLFKLEFKQELDKHVVLTSVQPLERERFFETLQSTLKTNGKHLLVFVHGYNVSFEDATRRTAQMAHDLKFPGAPVCYSWPSQANWYGYATDRENIELSVNQIKEFLVDLAKRSGAETINLVAHSMGNVGLTEALKEIDQAGGQPMFNQVVLAAPDIDADVFKERIAPSIVTKAKHVTLYTSQTDLALIASRYFNHGQRVGDSAGGVWLLPGIETIDATSIDSSLIGHSYYGSNVTVLSDLGQVLNNQPASSRAYLQSIPSDPVPYWTFDVAKISQAASSANVR